MIFDLEKFETIHFSWKTAFPNLEIILSLPVSANSIVKPKVIKLVLKKVFL